MHVKSNVIIFHFFFSFINFSFIAAAGVGVIRIIDYDKVELSNLNRQILYNTKDIGKFKAEAAALRLLELNPTIKIEPLVEELSENNFDNLLSGFDIIYEGGNSMKSRKDFNKLAVSRNFVYIHASAQYNYAYVFSVVPFKSACFECIFYNLNSNHSGPVPVLGCSTGIAGTVAANEGINILHNKKTTLDLLNTCKSLFRSIFSYPTG